MPQRSQVTLPLMMLYKSDSAVRGCGYSHSVAARGFLPHGANVCVAAL